MYACNYNHYHFAIKYFDVDREQECGRYVKQNVQHQPPLKHSISSKQYKE